MIQSGELVYDWPEHYPGQCPSKDATELVGTVYRFINGRNPVDRDFLSHYEKNPNGTWADACKARGLSVLRTISDCGEMRDAVPALRKKRLAVADISGGVGLIARTPSGSCQGHCTWWRNPAPRAVTALFATLDESAEVENG